MSGKLWLPDHEAKLSEEAIASAIRLKTEQEALRTAQIDRAGADPYAPRVVAWDRSWTLRRGV